jgi:hypothetical protein
MSGLGHKRTFRIGWQRTAYRKGKYPAPNRAQCAKIVTSQEPRPPMPSLADDWPFDDPPNVAVVTTRDVTEDKVPILFVSHDRDDGAWQFLTGGPVLEENARVVALRRIWLLDPSVGQLADLPMGWQAFRSSPLDPWRKRPRGAG